MTGMDSFNMAVSIAMFMIMTMFIVLILDYDQTVRELRKGVSWLADKTLHLFGYQLIPEYRYYKQR